ncbi:MAG: ABC transporter permease [Chloroflexi bacterium]|nr:ABC transporter permease [Chloroflexota bacterium]
MSADSVQLRESGQQQARASERRFTVPSTILLLIPLTVFLLVFFVLPFGVMFQQSFFITPLQANGNVSATLANYAKLFGDFFYVKVLLQTVALGVAVTVCSLLLAFPVAYVLARTETRWRQLLVFLVISPLMVSIIIRSFGWMVLLGRAGTINTTLLSLGLIQRPLELMYNWSGVVISLTHVLLPFMILTLSSVIESIPVSLEETAAVLGAGRWARFRFVLLPLSMEGIGAGLTLVFMLAIGSFVSVLLVGGSETLVLPLLIYQQIILLNNNFAASIATMLLVISLGLLYFQARAFRVRGSV